MAYESANPFDGKSVKKFETLTDSQLETGMMFNNNIDWVDAAPPFGGIKDSGHGRELGTWESKHS